MWWVNHFNTLSLFISMKCELEVSTKKKKSLREKFDCNLKQRSRKKKSLHITRLNFTTSHIMKTNKILRNPTNSSTLLFSWHQSSCRPQPANGTMVLSSTSNINSKHSHFANGTMTPVTCSPGTLSPASKDRR